MLCAWGVPLLMRDTRSAYSLIGSGVEIEKIRDDKFNVTELLKKFARRKVNLLGCGTCMGLRHQVEAGVILKSTLTDLMKIIVESDKVVTFG